MPESRDWVFPDCRCRFDIVLRFKLEVRHFPACCYLECSFTRLGFEPAQIGTAASIHPWTKVILHPHAFHAHAA